ncbi:hypothetical protein [Synechococcus sp. BS56D]|uniref:hypothetical protein n=1 Tax=Synechococcus sp. BS56D TaxID=2055944 RepID=UPI001F0EFF2D|nr:hypothetical protein [Synechococcus sp. BS56D]
MPLRRTKRWNLMAAVALLLAAMLAVSGISQLDLQRDADADRLQLSALPHRSSIRLEQQRRDGWSSLRSDRMSERELQQDAENAAAATYRVTVGVYATNTYDLDLSVPSFASNGYIWLRWQEPLQRYLEQQQLGLEDRVILLNQLLSDADPGLKPIGDPERLDDGSYYQLFSYLGRFYIDRASFRRFPFTTVSLPLVLEADDVDGVFEYANLRFVPDVKNSGVGLFSGIIGWLKRGWSIAEYRHQYATNFGLGGPAAAYSTLVYDIAFGTSSWSAFWRLILPLLVVMAMVLLVFKVRADEQDARAGIPVTVLLTLVFLQQTYRDELPQLPFLTFLDQVYVVAYVVTLLAFVLVIWIGRRYNELEAMPEGPQRQALAHRLHTLDELWPLSVVGFTTVSVVLCWLTLPPLS